MFAISSVFLECITAPFNQTVPFYDNCDKYMKYRYNFLRVCSKTGDQLTIFHLAIHTVVFFFLAVLVLSVSSRLYQKFIKDSKLDMEWF